MIETIFGAPGAQWSEMGEIGKKSIRLDLMIRNYSERSLTQGMTQFRVLVRVRYSSCEEGGRDEVSLFVKPLLETITLLPVGRFWETLQIREAEFCAYFELSFTHIEARCEK